MPSSRLIESARAALPAKALPAALVLVLLAGCRRGPEPRLDAALAALVPQDAVAIACFDLERLRATPVYRQLVEERTLPQIDRFAAETRLDPRRDINQLVLTYDGKSVLALARGRFNAPANAPNAAHNRHTLYGDERAAWAILDPQTSIAGPTPAVRALLDARDAKRAGAPERLLARAAAISKANQIWAVSTGGFAPLPLDGVEGLANFTQVFGRMEESTLAIEVQQGIRMSLAGLCATPGDARKLHDALRGLAGFARLRTPSGQPETLRLLDNLAIKLNERRVTVDFSVPGELVGWLGERLAQAPTR